MRENNFQSIEIKSKKKKTFYRWVLFLILGIFALYYITPLYVMIVTSFKSMEEIRQGNLLYLPQTLNFESWKVAWLSLIHI